MYSPARDLAVVAGMVAELEPYLLSPELYWPLSGPPLPGGQGYPRLTPGGLLLALVRLSAVERELPAAQAAGLARSRLALEATRNRWRAGLDRKIAQEVKSRLDLWSAYLGDCVESRTRCAESFPQQVAYRAMLTLLLAEIGGLPPDSPHPARLAEADHRFRAFFRPGDFVWEAELRPGFPRAEFWYLYGSVA